MNIIEARGLAKYYGTHLAVNHIDLSIISGECFGLLGPNGAGKTTTMSMIHCSVTPSGGSLSVFGMDVMRQPSEIKARLGVMPQDDNLDVDLSCHENLLVHARYFGITKAQSSPRALELLKFVGLYDVRDRNIRELSGGMKRRLLLARTLINEPELVVLDEPTTGMDPRSRLEVWENMRRLRDKGATILLSTHYMEEAQRICDRVAIMDRGRIVSVDSPKALMQLHGGSLEDVYLKLTGRALDES